MSYYVTIQNNEIDENVKKVHVSQRELHYKVFMQFFLNLDIVIIRLNTELKKYFFIIFKRTSFRIKVSCKSLLFKTLNNKSFFFFN